MKKLRIYVDTSVVGGCFDREFFEDSIALFDMARKGKIILLVSDLLVAELDNAPEKVLQLFKSLPADNVERIDISEDALNLKNKYIKAHVLGHASENDALHVAIASVHNADMIVSWNFKHIVHYDKIKGFNAVNIREGYGVIAIHSPKEVV